MTGGSAGIGRQAALELARRDPPPAEVWIASRDPDGAAADISRAVTAAAAGGGVGGVGGVVVRPLRLDLASFASVREAARTFAAAAPRLDVLVLNAGLMGGPAAATTADGYELRFGLNYVGHALLVKLLLPQLLAAAADADRDGGPGPRIVALSSGAHSYTVPGGIRFDALKGTGEHVERMLRYGQSKLALLLWAREMAWRQPRITTVSVHPGTVKTDIFNNPEGGLTYRLIQRLFVPVFGLTVEDGAKNTLWAATADDIVSGEYYEPIGMAGKGSALSTDRGLAKKLWEWTEEEMKGYEL